MLLGALSAKYESGSDPAIVAQNPSDSGGWSYGVYQFSSTMGVVQAFVTWLEEYEVPFNEYGRQLALAGNPTYEQAFVDKWVEIGTIDAKNFWQLQDDFAQTLYFKPGAQNLKVWYDFDITNRSLSLQQVLFSNCVQHGTYYGSSVFDDVAKLLGQSLQNLSDYDLIYNIYEIKITDPSWSAGSPELRPALFARWENERQDALNQLG